jgi:hypothetical protein
MPDKFGGIEVDEFGGVMVDEPVSPPTVRPPGALPVEPAFNREVAATDVPLGSVGRGIESGGALLGRGAGGTLEFVEKGGVPGMALRKVLGDDIGGTIGKVIGTVTTAPLQAVGALGRLAGGGEVVAPSGQAASDYWKQKSEDIGQRQEKFDPGAYSFQLSQGAVSTVPSLAAGPAGLTAMAAVAGAQVFGSTLADAADAYEKQGMTRQQAIDKAAPWAALDGLQTALLTRIMPYGEASIAAAMKAGGAKEATNVAAEIVNKYFKKLTNFGPQLPAALNKPARFLSAFAKGAAGEAAEEGINQILSGAISKWSYEPDKTWAQIWDEAKLAGSIGGVLGGMMEPGGNLLGKALDRNQPSTGQVPITPPGSIPQPEYQLGEVPVFGISGMVPRDTIFETPRIQLPTAPVKPAGESYFQRPAPTPDVELGLREGAPDIGSTRTPIDRMMDIGSPGTVDRAIDEAAARRAAPSTSPVRLARGELTGPVESEPTSRLVQLLKARSQQQPSTQPTESYASTIRGGEKVVPKARLSGQTGEGNRGGGVEQAASRQPEPVAAGTEGAAAKAPDFIAGVASQRPTGKVGGIVWDIRNGRIGGLKAKVLMRDYGDTKALVEINGERFVIDDSTRLKTAGIETDYSSKVASQYFKGVKTAKDLNDLLAKYPKLGFEDFKNYKKVGDQYVYQPTKQPSAETGIVDTIAGKMGLQEFEQKGYSPEQVTKSDWVNLQRAERRRLGQQEGGDSEYLPWGEYEQYHRDAVMRALAKGEEVDPEVLKDYPDLKPTKQPAVEPPERQVKAIISTKDPRLMDDSDISKEVSALDNEMLPLWNQLEALGDSAYVKGGRNSPEAQVIYNKIKPFGDRKASLLSEQTRRNNEAQNKRNLEARDKRVAEAPVYQTRNGWEIIKDGFDYVLRDPVTKEDVYRGKLSRVREVADESAPERQVIQNEEKRQEGLQVNQPVEQPIKPAVAAPGEGSIPIPPQSPTQLPPVAPAAPKSRLPSGRRTGKLPAALKKEAATPEPVKQKQGFDTKAAKEQKRYLLEEVDKAIADAPETRAVVPADSDMAALDDARMSRAREDIVSFAERERATVEALANKYGVPWGEKKAGISPLGDAYIKMKFEQVEGKIRDAIFKQSDTILISVPGDGKFTLFNSKTALRDFKERAKRFPTTAPKQSLPSKPRLTPTTAPATGKMIPENIAKAAAIHASIEPTRKIINLIYSDGKVTVATDGRRLIQIDKGLGGTPENPKLFHEDGKPLTKAEMEEVGNYPNWKQVIPSDENLFAAFKGLDIERLNNVLQQATQATSEKQNSVNLYRNPDGSIAVTSATSDLGDYQHNLQDGAKILGAYSPKFLVDAIKAAKLLGNEKVDIWYTDELAPMVIKATGMKVVIMPMRDGGPLSTESPNVLKESDVTKYKPLPAAKNPAPLEPSPKSKTLTMDDVSAARQLTDEERNRLAAPVIAKLRGLGGGGGNDKAGIPDRGGSIYDQALEGQFNRDQMAAARVALMELGASSRVVDAIESATVKEPTTQPTATATSQPTGPVSEQSSVLSAASRFRPRELVTFDKPLVGPSGASLVAYEWQWQPEEYVDKYGEDRVRRVSDWEKATSSSESGRDIVHQFRVKMPDGSVKIVSSESVVQLLGYTERNAPKNLPSLVSATKTLAKLKMQLSIAESKIEHNEKILVEVRKIPAPIDQITSEKAHKNSPNSKAVAFLMPSPEGTTGAKIYQVQWEPGKPSDYTIDSLVSQWKGKLAAKMGVVHISEDVKGLRDRIAKQERKISDILKSDISTVSTTTQPAEPPTGQPTERNWDLLLENIEDSLESFSPARDTGRLNYELIDVAQRFIDYAKADKSGRPLTDLIGDFSKQDAATASQIKKLKAAVTEVTSKPDYAIEETAPTWYSRITRTVEQSPQNKASGAQWKAMIRNSKLGVSKDEYALVSVDDLEDGRTYTKQEVLDYLRANEVKVEYVTLGESNLSKSQIDNLNKEWREIDFKELRPLGFRPDVDNLGRVVLFDKSTNQKVDQNSYNLPEKVRDLYWRLQSIEDIKRQDNKVDTHFSTYQLPGGKEGSYREVLLTTPEIVPKFEWTDSGPIKLNLEGKYGGLQITDSRQWEAEINGSNYEITWHPNRGAKGMYVLNGEHGGIQNAGFDTLEQAKEYATKGTNYKYSQRNVWQDGHSQYSDIANPIVRLRFNERTTADGKRMLFLEEVQAPQKGQFEKMPALFQKNWREIAFKWALRHAAENGFDSVGWTTGEMQADRYNLEKRISSEGIKWSNNKSSGTISLYAENRDSGGVLINKEVKPNEVSDWVGKDIAAQIEASINRGSNVGQITGNDLKVGGEGLKKLYDVDFRNVVNGLPVVKKSGQKVGVSDVNAGQYARDAKVVQGDFPGFWTIRSADGQLSGNYSSRSDAEAALEKVGVPSPSRVQSITITPEMRDAVMAGQNMFSKANQSPAGWVEVQGNPPLTEADVRAAVDPILSNWQGVTFNLVNDPNWTSGEDSLIGGMRSGNEITLNLAAIGSKERAVALLLHEGVGHLGIRGALGTDFVRVMDEVWNMMTPENHAEVVKLVKRYGSDRTNLTAEWVARQAEKGATGSTWQRIWQRVMDWFAKVFGQRNAEAIARDLFRQGSKWLRTNPDKRVEGKADYSIEEANRALEVAEKPGRGPEVQSAAREFGGLTLAGEFASQPFVREEIEKAKQVATFENLEKYRRAKSTLLKPLLDVQNLETKLGQDARSYAETRNDPNIDPDKRDVATLNALSTFTKYQQSYQSFKANAENLRQQLTRKLIQLDKELGDAYKPGTLEYQKGVEKLAGDQITAILKDGMAHAVTDAEKVEANRVLGQLAGVGKATKWIIENVPNWQTYTSGNDLVAEAKRLAGDDYRQRMEANDDAIRDASRLVVKFQAKYEQVLAQRDAAMTMTIDQATEYKKQMEAVRDDLKSGKINSAIIKYRSAISTIAVKKANIRDAIALIHRQQTGILNRLDAIAQLETLMDNIRRRPEFNQLGEALAADIGYASPIDIYDDQSGTVRLAGFPGKDEVILSLKPDKATAEANHAKIEAYHRKAIEYVQGKDTNPEYDPFIGKALEFWANNRVEILKSRALLPDNPSLIPSFSLAAFKRMGDFLWNSTSIPYFNMLFGKGFGFDRLAEFFNAGAKMQKAAQTVYAKLWPAMDEKLMAARKAHNLATIGEYWEKVFNPIAYSRQYFAHRPLRVGDSLGTGHVVKQEDLELLEKQGAFSREMSSVIRNQGGMSGTTSQMIPAARGILEKYPGLNFFYRDQLATGPNTLPRHWGRVFSWLDEQSDTGKTYSEIGNEARRVGDATYRQAKATGEARRRALAEIAGYSPASQAEADVAAITERIARQMGQRAYWNVAKQFEDFVNRHNDTLLFGYIKWANEATNTTFQYKYADALDDIGRQMIEDNEPVGSVQELAEAIHAREIDRYQNNDLFDQGGEGIPSVEQIKQDILSEIDRLLIKARDYRDELRAELESPGQKDMRLRSGVSSLTQARGKQILPGEWYDYGNLGKDSMLAQVANVSKPAFIEMAKLLDQMVLTTEAKAKELAESGLTEKQLRERRAKGLDFYSADEAREAANELIKIQKWLRHINAEHEGNIETQYLGGIGRMDNAWRVVLRLITSRLLAGGSSMINNLGGGSFMDVMQRVGLDIPANDAKDFANGAGVSASSWGTFRGAPAAVKSAIDLTKAIAERSTMTMTGLFKYFTGKAANATQIKALRNLNEWAAASLLEQRRKWQTYQDLGLDSNMMLRDRFWAYMNQFETGGESVDNPVTPPSGSRLMERLSSGSRLSRILRNPGNAAKAAAIAISEVSAQGGVAWVDAVINRAVAGNLATDFEQLMQVLAHQVMPAKAETAGVNWKDANDPANFWTPQEIAHSNKGVEAEKIGIARRNLVRLTGNTWEQLMTDYWNRYTQWLDGGKQGEQPRFLKDDKQRNALLLAVATRTNWADFTVRPLATHAGGAQEAMMYLFGWPIWGVQEMLSAFAKPSSKTGRRLLPESADLANVSTFIALAIPLAMLALTFPTLRDYWAEKAKGYRIKALTPRYFIEKGLAGESVDPMVATKIMASSMATFIPFFGSVMNNWLDNASRNGFDLQQQILALNLANDAWNTVKEAGETGDPTFSALRFASRWLLPDVAPRLIPNILPIESAKTLSGSLENRSANNIAAQAAALANIENRRSSTGQATFRYTEATPLIRGWMAAMATGDDRARADFFERLVAQKREDIIAKTPEIDPGQADTEARAAALSSLRTRNPFVTALGRMPTEQEYATMMGKLTPDAREKLTAYMAGYDRAIQQDSGGTATIRSFTTPGGASVTTARASTAGPAGFGGGGRLPSVGSGGQRLPSAGVGAAAGGLSGGLPSITRIGGTSPRLTRFSVARRIAGVGRAKLPRLRLPGAKLPSLAGRVKRPRLPRRGLKMIAAKKPRLRRTTLA